MPRITTPEEITQDFYNKIGEWMDSGFQLPSCFSLSVGLCGNFVNFALLYGLRTTEAWDMRRYMESQFQKRMGDTNYPFNNRDRHDYDDESDQAKCYQNPLRIKWIQEYRNDILSHH